MEVDRELIEQRLAEIEETLIELEGMVRRGREEFLSNNMLRNAAKYLLITAMEGAFSVCNHISVRKGRVPKSYSECFQVLSKLGVIDREPAEELSRMTKFRNLLVHRYWRIDDEIVFAYLHGSVLETKHPWDLDVEVYVEGIDNPLEYELSLSVELERTPGMEVDVRLLNDAPPAFRYGVVSWGEVVLSRDEERRMNSIERTVEEYLGFEPLERIARRELLAG